MKEQNQDKKKTERIVRKELTSREAAREFSEQMTQVNEARAQAHRTMQPNHQQQERDNE